LAVVFKQPVFWLAGLAGWTASWLAGLTAGWLAGRLADDASQPSMYNTSK